MVHVQYMMHPLAGITTQVYPSRSNNAMRKNNTEFCVNGHTAHMIQGFDTVAYNSPRYNISALVFLSSLACVFFGPHLATCLSFLAFTHAVCSFDAGAAILTKTGEQSNLRASWFTLHLRGSSSLRRRISLTSSAERWYRGLSGRPLYFISGARSFGVVEEEGRPRRRWMADFRGSLRGRKMNGVCAGEASEEGGL